MKFYGRKEELATIDGWFRAVEKGALFTAIVGRRRIGKTRLWLEAKAISIAGGSNEIQLNIIAKRVLGLPD